MSASTNISAISEQLLSGALTSSALTSECLARIEADNHRFHAVRESNSDALRDAKQRDDELAAGRRRSPLHGIPVLLKDSIATADGTRTTFGVAAFADLVTPFEASIVSALRDAGAVILGKCSCTDFGDYMSSTMPAEHSTTGGTVINPRGVAYGRGGGSSTGCAAALAAEFAPIAIGSEAQNSIQGPAANSGLVGLKPTVGLLGGSREPSLVRSHTTAGPMTRDVKSAAITLAVIADSAYTEDYATQCGDKDLTGIRLGLPRVGLFGRSAMAQYDEAVERAVALMSVAGATIVDPAEIETVEEIIATPSSVFKTEFKIGLHHLLHSCAAATEHRSLSDIIAYNERHAADAIPYGQDLLIASDNTIGDGSETAYRTDRERDVELTRQRGIDHTLETFALDALIAPMDFAAKITGKAGYPAITVPCGETSFGKPAAVTFIGTAYSESKLIAIAHAFERAQAAQNEA